MKALCSLVAVPLLPFIAAGILARLIWFGICVGLELGGEFMDWMGGDQ